MGEASLDLCLSVSPCCSYVTAYPYTRSKTHQYRPLAPLVEQSGFLWKHGSLTMNARRPVSCTIERRKERADVNSSWHTKQGVWQGRAKVGIAVLVGSLLVEANAEAAESVADACVGFAGANGSIVVIVACIAQAIALTGAAVGGVIARQRKNELEKINGQLRQINVNLRRQVRMESYAPSLTYAPVGAGRVLDMPVRTDPAREQLMQYLKGGKQLLREHNHTQAFREFEKALPIARQLGDPVEEKKAARGLGASCQRQGKYKEAIKYHTMVLSVSQKTGEHSGNTEAYGAIADCYTELGDLESAAKFYDQYIERLESEDSE